MKKSICILLSAICAMSAIPMTSCSGSKVYDGYELYMLAPEPSSLMNSFVIKTPHNKIIVIDGGLAGFGKESPVYLPSAIRAILGIGQNDYFEVEAWFLSHSHNDHYTELSKMLNGYYSDDPACNYKINNFYFDFPDYSVWNSKGGKGDHDAADLESLKNGFQRYFRENELFDGDMFSLPSDYAYNKLNGAVINKESVEAGLSFEIDGAKFDILQTRDENDLVVNSTSIIIRATLGTKTILFLGDAYIDTGNRLLKKYSGEELKSDYVQMAHHGQSGTSEDFYNAIDTKNSVRLWPAPKWVWEVYNATNGIKTDITRSWLGLPADFEVFKEEGYLDTGNDIVAGLYEFYPDDPTKVQSWKGKVLDCQRVFREKP